MAKSLARQCGGLGVGGRFIEKSRVEGGVIDRGKKSSNLKFPGNLMTKA